MIKTNLHLIDDQIKYETDFIEPHKIRLLNLLSLKELLKKLQEGTYPVQIYLNGIYIFGGSFSEDSLIKITEFVKDKKDFKVIFNSDNGSKHKEEPRPYQKCLNYNFNPLLCELIVEKNENKYCPESENWAKKMRIPILEKN